MQRLAARFVKVEGIGRFNDNDEWEMIKVREIVAERSVLDEFYAREPNSFGPIRATGFAQRDYNDQADMDEFIRIIHGERNS